MASVTGLPQVEGTGGFELTTKVSVAKLPVSSVVLINKLSDVFIYVASVDAVTSTLIVHLLKPGTVMFENERDVSPPVREAGEGVPQFKYERLGVPATLTPAGKVSAKLTPVNAAVPGLSTVNVRVEVWPG